MTRANDLPSSESAPSPSAANVVDFAAYAATRRAAAATSPVEETLTASEELVEDLQAVRGRSDTDMLIEAMRALAVARARLDRLSREAAECRRKLDSIKLG